LKTYKTNFFIQTQIKYLPLMHTLMSAAFGCGVASWNKDKHSWL